MKRIFNLFLLFLFIPFIAFGNENFEVGTKLSVIGTCEIWSLPVWKGIMIQKANRGSVLTFLSYDENKYWIKIKTEQEQEGFVAAAWVTPVVQIIENIKSDQITKTDSENIASESVEKLYISKASFLKSKPSNGGKKIEELIIGDELISLGQDGYWHKVKTPSGTIGYIEISSVWHESSKKLTELKLKEDNTILHKSLNKLFKNIGFNALIDHPGESWKIVETVDTGEKLKLLSIEENLCKVETKNGKVGYIPREAVIASIQREEVENKRISEKKQKENTREKRINSKFQNWSQEIKNAVIEHKVHIGMTMEQCRESWGNPDRVNNTTTAYGTDTQWCYGDFCSNALYFHNGTLKTIQN